jgi:hypothetical protein
LSVERNSLVCLHVRRNPRVTYRLHGVHVSFGPAFCKPNLVVFAVGGSRFLLSSLVVPYDLFA